MFCDHITVHGTAIQNVTSKTVVYPYLPSYKPLVPTFVHYGPPFPHMPQASVHHTVMNAHWVL